MGISFASLLVNIPPSRIVLWRPFPISELHCLFYQSDTGRVGGLVLDFLAQTRIPHHLRSSQTLLSWILLMGIETRCCSALSKSDDWLSPNQVKNDR